MGVGHILSEALWVQEQLETRQSHLHLKVIMEDQQMEADQVAAVAVLLLLEAAALVVHLVAQEAVEQPLLLQVLL